MTARAALPATGPAHGAGPVQILRRLNVSAVLRHLQKVTPTQANEGTPLVRLASGRLPGARMLLAVTSTALAAGVMAGTASTATASATRPAARTATSVMQPGITLAFGCPYPDQDIRCPFR